MLQIRDANTMRAVSFLGKVYIRQLCTDKVVYELVNIKKFQIQLISTYYRSC